MTAEKSEPAASSCFGTELISFKYRWIEALRWRADIYRWPFLLLGLKGGQLFVAHESALDRRVFSLHVCNKAIFLAAQKLPRKLDSRNAALHIPLGAEPVNGEHLTDISSSVGVEILWRS